MNNLEQNLQAYLQQVQKILDEKKEAVNERDLQDIAIRLGLSSEDIAWIEEQFRGYFERGKAYVSYKQPEKGISELKQALRLKPFEAQTLYWLAVAYFQLWQKRGKKNYKNQARKYAELCLKVDYKQAKALDLMQQLNKKSKHWQRKRSALLNLVWTTVGVFAVLAVVALVLLYYWKVNQKPEEASKPEQPKVEIPKPKKEIITKKDITDIPVQIIKNEKSLGLELQTESSFVKENEGEHFYLLKTCFLNEQTELTKLLINLELLNKNQVIVFQENIELLNETLPEMRPSDALALSKKASLEEEVVQARIRIIEIEEQAIEDYEPSKTIDFQTEIENPNYNTALQFSLKERYQTITTSAQSFNHTIVFEFENIGEKPINSLELELNWFNNASEPIHTETLFLISEDEPYLPTTQRRVKQLSFSVNFKHQNFSRYEVKVLNIK